MARHVDEPDLYSERTQASPYAYSHEPYYDEPRPAAASNDVPRPWYRGAPALIALGALIAIVLALAIYGVIELASRPTPTSSTTTPTTSTSATSLAPSNSLTPAPSTVGDGGANTAVNPAPIARNTDTGTSIAPSTETPAPSTVTQTVIAPRIPFVPPITVPGQ